MISFEKNEVLTAKKLTDLSLVAHKNRLTGDGVTKLSDKTVLKNRQQPQSIPNYKPFEVERDTDETLTVRGGVWEHVTSDGRIVVEMDVDGSTTSASPEDFITITPTLSSSTDYSVYLHLDLSTSPEELSANVIDTASYPTADSDNKYLLLTTFKSTADSTLPDIDEKQAGFSTTNGLDVRGTEGIFKAVVLRAYLNSSDTLVDAGTTYNDSTMYLYPTWDYIRVTP